MANIYLLLCAAVIVWYFLAQRKIEEKARIAGERYCDQQHIQFIAIAKIKSRLKFSTKEGMGWLSYFSMEFSGDGESSYTGQITMKGGKLVAIDLPPYRMN